MARALETASHPCRLSDCAEAGWKRYCNPHGCTPPTGRELFPPSSRIRSRMPVIPTPSPAPVFENKPAIRMVFRVTQSPARVASSVNVLFSGQRTNFLRHRRLTRNNNLDQRSRIGICQPQLTAEFTGPLFHATNTDAERARPQLHNLI